MSNAAHPEGALVSTFTCARPSAICNGQAWWPTLETLPHKYPANLARREYRYPFLDRDLVEYLFQVPREQLVRPGQRRSLMRRTFKEIMPAEILNRRRKAYVSHAPLAALRESRVQIESLLTDAVAAQLDIFDPHILLEHYYAAINGQDTRFISAITSSILFELWLRMCNVPRVYSDLSEAMTTASRRHFANKARLQEV